LYRGRSDTADLEYGKMKKTVKIPLSRNVLIFLALSWALQACLSTKSASTSPVNTPAQAKYTEAFIASVSKVEQEGVTTVKEIRVEESQPFIFILRPQSKEITDEDVKNVTELALRAVSVFDSGGGLRHDDIDIPFHRPTEQKILLIKRHDVPELLSASIYGEVTISIDKTYVRSLINLAGPAKNRSQEFANAWSVVQAICLGYAGDFQDNDPICNIISANAAAGWVGMDEQSAAELINSYGMTNLSYLGSTDYRYRFIDFVYEEFSH
jgi:hypothetical protein